MNPLALALRSTAWWGWVAIVCFSLPLPAAEAPPQQPNILFILLDNAGKDWFRCYGSQENVTPTIDRLAATGVKFRSISARKIRAALRQGSASPHEPPSSGKGLPRK